MRHRPAAGATSVRRGPEARRWSWQRQAVPVAALVVAGGALTSLASPVSAALPGDQSTPEQAVAVAAAPYSSVLTGDDGTAASPGATNAAVGLACNGGRAITAARWWSFSTPAATTVFVRASYTRQSYDARPFPTVNLPSGLALVSESGQVLRCSAGDVPELPPRFVTPTEKLFLVHFLTSCTPQFRDADCSDDTAVRELLIRPAASVGRPGNDDWQNAAPVADPLPRTFSADTTFATTQGEDPLNAVESCFHSGSQSYYAPELLGPFKTVWWSYTPTASGPVTLSVDGQPQIGGIGQLADLSLLTDGLGSSARRWWHRVPP